MLDHVGCHVVKGWWLFTGPGIEGETVGTILCPLQVYWIPLALLVFMSLCIYNLQ